MTDPQWLQEHRANRPYDYLSELRFSRPVNIFDGPTDELVHVAETSFNNHDKNTGEHVSPFDNGTVQIGVDGIEVRLLQGVDMDRFKQVIYAGKQATIGVPRPKGPGPMSDYRDVSEAEWREMFRGGLQAALESQTVVFEVWGTARVVTHQLVRSRRAGFHQQSQRSTWYGDRPEVRMPETVWRSSPEVRAVWSESYLTAWAAYQTACDAGVPYEDARYILPEGTTNYIQCEYTIREFINVFAYRGCSMFLREMVTIMRKMREVLLAQCPDLEPYIKISCEKGKLCTTCYGSGWLHPDGVPADESEVARIRATFGDDPESLIVCSDCNGLGGDRKCTFQGWENVEHSCSFPWAKESNRTFLATPRLRIGAKS